MLGYLAGPVGDGVDALGPRQPYAQEGTLPLELQRVEYGRRGRRHTGSLSHEHPAFLAVGPSRRYGPAWAAEVLDP